MRNTSKLLSLLLSVLFLLNACSKDDDTNSGPEPEPAPTTRILSASLQTSGTGLPALTFDYVFVYKDDKNELEGVAEVKPDGSINTVWVFLYDAMGKPETAARVASDLTTILDTITFRYSGNQLVGIDNRLIRIENNRIVQTDSTILGYNASGSLEKVFRLTPNGSQTEVGQITTNASLRYPWARLLPRVELQAVIPFVVPTVSIIEATSRNAITAATGRAADGSTVNISYTYSGSEDGFVTNTDRSIPNPGNRRILNFSYEPIPK